MHIINVTNDQRQEQSFSIFDMNLRLTLNYNRVGCSWDMDLFNTDTNSPIAQRVGLSLAAAALIGLGLPFVVTLIDTSGSGLNPTRQNDLVGRFQLVFIARDAYYAAIRQTIQA